MCPHACLAAASISQRSAVMLPSSLRTARKGCAVLSRSLVYAYMSPSLPFNRLRVYRMRSFLSLSAAVASSFSRRPSSSRRAWCASLWLGAASSGGTGCPSGGVPGIFPTPATGLPASPSSNSRAVAHCTRSRPLSVRLVASVRPQMFRNSAPVARPHSSHVLGGWASNAPRR